MSGVYMQENIFCPVCNEVTEHATGWESEEPNVTHIQCMKCEGPRLKSGMEFKEGLNWRLVSKENQPKYHAAIDRKFNRLQDQMRVLGVFNSLR